MTRAVEALRSCSYIVCDCEGVSLGGKGGKLSLISLRALPTVDNPVPHIYLIDAIALDDRVLRPVYDLLQSNVYTKVMFDARMDWCELYHRHGVNLTRVLDLQLADVLSRRRRGEDSNRQLERLSPFLKTDEVRRHRELYALVQRLNGLGSCITEHGIVSNQSKPVKARKLLSTYRGMLYSNSGL
jgi:exonuclease 3'-5' domain-containing protein 1